MRAQALAALHAAAATFLDSFHVERGPFVVSVIDAAGVEHRAPPCHVWPQTAPAAVPQNPPPAPAANGHAGKWLSHLEGRIVEYLERQPGRTSGESIAQALGEPHQHRFKAILTNLCDREILEGVTGSGYRIAPG